jgi:hypothetical protein
MKKKDGRRETRSTYRQRETQTHGDKWVQTLIFWVNFQKVVLDNAKEKGKNCGSVCLFVNVTIPDTHAMFLRLNERHIPTLNQLCRKL